MATPVDEAEAVASVLENGDILCLVFRCLGLEDLCRSAGVCKQWRDISASPAFWTTADLSKHAVSPFQVLAMARKHPSIRCLNLSRILLNEVQLQLTFNSLIWLEELELGEVALGEAELAALSERLPQLQRLTLRNSTLGHQAMQAEVVVAHAGLKEVALLGCSVVRLALRCRLARSLDLRGTALAGLAAHCPGLQALSMHSCRKISDMALRVALLRLPTLTSLDLSAVLPLSDYTLAEVGTSLTRLTRLEVAGCAGLTLNGLRGFGALRHLDLAACDSLAPAVAMAALEALTGLTQLCLERCPLLGSVSLALRHLRRLSLRGCRALASVEVQCPRLEALEVGPADGTATGASAEGCPLLRRIGLHSARITRLSWRGFPLLRSLDLTCPDLTALDLSDCDSLTSDVFDTLGDAGCPSLRELRLEGCEGLRSGRLASGSLAWLSLASSKGLARLHLACPLLQHIGLDQCDALVEVRLERVAVEALWLGTCPHLSSLHLSGPAITRLDLKGCGGLARLELECSGLTALDATFCGALTDAGLAAALAQRPPLQQLVLSVCSALTNAALPALAPLTGLRLLDLDNTAVHDLGPVYAACSGLRTLVLSSCRGLRSDALAPLLPTCAGGQPPALPALTELDVSYCSLPAQALAGILARAPRLQVVAMNGCVNATSAIWDCINLPQLPEVDGVPPQPHALASLSCVRCKGMAACTIGMARCQPEAGHQGEGTMPTEPHEDIALQEWVPVPTVLAGLQALRLGLSSVRSVALALPRLTSLDLNGCRELRHLHLRCPALLAAFLQACVRLPALHLWPGLAQCGALERLDLQHVAVQPRLLACLRAAHPSLRTLLHCNPQPPAHALFASQDAA